MLCRNQINKDRVWSSRAFKIAERFLSDEAFQERLHFAFLKQHWRSFSKRGICVSFSVGDAMKQVSMFIGRPRYPNGKTGWLLNRHCKNEIHIPAIIGKNNAFSAFSTTVLIDLKKKCYARALQLRSAESDPFSKKRGIRSGLSCDDMWNIPSARLQSSMIALCGNSPIKHPTRSIAICEQSGIRTLLFSHGCHDIEVEDFWAYSSLDTFCRWTDGSSSPWTVLGLHWEFHFKTAAFIRAVQQSFPFRLIHHL